MKLRWLKPAVSRNGILRCPSKALKKEVAKTHTRQP